VRTLWVIQRYTNTCKSLDEGYAYYVKIILVSVDRSVGEIGISE
jgi:hypothetical protein